MTATENLQIQAVELKMAQLIQVITENRREEERDERIRELPEWITLERAAALKGGAAYETYNTKYWLQPCCGLKSRRIGGRKSWHRDDVVEWLTITDEGLFEYAKKMGAKVPDKFREMTEAARS
jgi:hypothetical protein